MKNLIPLSALAFLILFGCAKEETTPATLSLDHQLSLDRSIYFTDLNSANQELKELSFEGLNFDQLVLAINSAAIKKIQTHMQMVMLLYPMGQILFSPPWKKRVAYMVK